jgi:hypothetical protein
MITAAKALEGLGDLGLDDDAKASFLGGNTARIRNLTCGLIEVGRASDLVVMDRAPRVQSASNAAPSGHKSGHNSVDCRSTVFTV